MLGSEHAADAVWLEHELDGGRDGQSGRRREFGC